jgi:hypothetical protein
VIKEKTELFKVSVAKYYTLLIREHEKFRETKHLVDSGAYRKQHKIALIEAAETAKIQMNDLHREIPSKEEAENGSSVGDLNQGNIES